jgi:L-alanine-DL-glutamate epimerase-like enolase superfamily enzyme
MIISDLEFYPLEIESGLGDQPIRTVVLRLSTYSGLDGWGEAAMPWRLSESVPRRDALLPILVGRSVFDIVELAELEALKEPALRSAIESACWDLIGKTAKQPICRLLGGEYRHRAPVVVPLPDAPSDALPLLAREWAAQGFHWQTIPCTGELEADVQRIESIADAAGERVEFRLDGRCQYDMETARDLCREIESRGIQLFYDPLKKPHADPLPSNTGNASAIADLISLGRQIDVPLGAARTIGGPSDVLVAVRTEGVSGIAIEPQRVGGLLAALQCANVAHAAGIRAALGGAATLGIAAAARLQLAACTPAFSLGNISTYVQLPEDVLVEPLEIVDGLIAVPLGPGIGVEVDRDKLERLARSA